MSAAAVALSSRLPVDDLKDRVTLGQSCGPRVGPDFQPHLGRGGRGVVAAGNIEDAAEDARGIGAKVPEREVYGLTLRRRLRLGDDVGAIAVATLLSHARQQGCAGWLDQAHSRAKAHSGSSGTILDQDIEAAGECSGGGQGQALARGQALLNEQPDQGRKAAKGSQCKKNRHRTPNLAKNGRNISVIPIDVEARAVPRSIASKQRALFATTACMLHLKRCYLSTLGYFQPKDDHGI
jgi:hypothetical protein